MASKARPPCRSPKAMPPSPSSPTSTPRPRTARRIGAPTRLVSRRAQVQGPRGDGRVGPGAAGVGGGVPGDGSAGRADGGGGGGGADVGGRPGPRLGDLLLGLAGAPLERRFEVVCRLLADALGLGFGMGDD